MTRLGAYSGADGQSTIMEDAATFDRWIEKVGTKPEIVMDFSNLTDPLLTDSRINSILTHNVTPMITWQLYRSGYDGPTISLSDIAGGRYDPFLVKAADQAKQLGWPILIRFAHEMNGDWYGWGQQPKPYIGAFRRMTEVFRKQGADNVKYVWAPNIRLPLRQYFPGKDVVDYVALDGYNWGDWKWIGFKEVFAEDIKKLRKFTDKPVMVAETSSTEEGGNKATWITEIKRAARELKLDTVIWFDRRLERNWRIDSSAESLEAFRKLAASL